MKFIILSLCAISAWAVPLAQEDHISVIKNIDSRIVGGNFAEIGQFPWQVAIFVETEDSQFFCGGALVAPNWILTGGRCAYGGTRFDLIFGAVSIGNRHVVRVSNYSETYPTFNTVTLEDDIGLIRIDDAVELNDEIQVIPFSRSDLKSEASVTVSGWGALSNSEGMPDVLNYVNLKTITNNECKFSYGILIPDEMVCAMGNRNNGICSGDSGDPLVWQDEDGKSILVGVASWSSAGGCTTSQPSTYTRTASYYSWIRSVIA